jgi:hypothetical protein
MGNRVKNSAQSQSSTQRAAAYQPATESELNVNHHTNIAVQQSDSAFVQPAAVNCGAIDKKTMELDMSSAYLEQLQQLVQTNRQVMHKNRTGKRMLKPTTVKPAAIIARPVAASQAA